MDARPDDQPPQQKTYTLEKEHELRVEVDFAKTTTITLVQGTAEIFGTELASEKKYTFTGTKFPVFTFHGCILEVSGHFHAYVANETPMIIYMNASSILEDRRIQARENGTVGPRVMLVGPMDTGKSSISKILLSYATRQGNQPIFVDIDIGQGSITIPGMVSAIHVTKPIDVEEGFALSTPLAYFFGHVSLTDNTKLYKNLLVQISKDVEQAFENRRDVAASGIVVNTCGWIDGLGYDLLLYSIQVMKIDVVFVIDHERLYNDLLNEVEASPTKLLDPTDPNSFLHKFEVVKLPKSGGVVTRPTPFRRKSRMQRIREYFYGSSGDLCPYSIVLDFRNIVLYRIGSGFQAPLSVLPIGATSTIDPTKLQEVTPSLDLLHSIIGVSHATSSDKVVETNLAGFLYVTDVNLERNKLTVLAPCPGLLPSKFLLVGSLKWIE